MSCLVASLCLFTIMLFSLPFSRTNIAQGKHRWVFNNNKLTTTNSQASFFSSTSLHLPSTLKLLLRLKARSISFYHNRVLPASLSRSQLLSDKSEMVLQYCKFLFHPLIARRDIRSTLRGAVESLSTQLTSRPRNGRGKPQRITDALRIPRRNSAPRFLAV